MKGGHRPPRESLVDLLEFAGLQGLVSACSTIPARRWAWRCSMRRTTTSTPRIRWSSTRRWPDLKALIPICNPKINITEYQTLPEGTSYLHEVWSGDMFSAVISYMPKDGDPSTLQYWIAAARQGPGAERLLGDLGDDQEAGARPSLPEPHHRRAGRLRQLPQLHRLPAAADLDHGGRPRREGRDTEEPGERRVEAGGSRQRFTAADGAHRQGPGAVAERLR